MNRMSDRGWRHIADGMNISEATVKNVWKQCQNDVQHRVHREEIIKSKEKAWRDNQTQCNEDAIIAIDSANIDKERNTLL